MACFCCVNRGGFGTKCVASMSAKRAGILSPLVTSEAPASTAGWTYHEAQPLQASGFVRSGPRGPAQGLWFLRRLAQLSLWNSPRVELVSMTEVLQSTCSPESKMQAFGTPNEPSWWKQVQVFLGVTVYLQRLDRDHSQISTHPPPKTFVGFPTLPPNELGNFEIPGMGIASETLGTGIAHLPIWLS